MSKKYSIKIQPQSLGGKINKLKIKDYCQQLSLYLILESQSITIKGMTICYSH